MKSVVLIAVLVSFIFLSCDLFETREAERPSASRENFPPATTPDVLLSNFTKAYKVEDESAYTACFIESDVPGQSYFFYPASGARESYPVFSDAWGNEEEGRFFKNLISKIPANSSISCVFLDSNSVNYGDSVLFTAKYSVIVPLQNSTLSYSGQLEMKFSVDDRLLWKIKSWNDIKTGTSQTWSDMKGYYYF